MARKLRRTEQVHFSATDPSPVIASMTRLAEAGDGWINLVPKLHDDDDRPTSLRFFTLLSGGGSGMTMCTWLPAGHDPQGNGQATLGITHVTGHRALPQLEALAVRLRPDWFVAQDHPKRGLVLHVARDEPHEEVLAWALAAAGALSPPRPIKGWRADVYLPLAS